MIEFKADIETRGDKFIPVVEEYYHGEHHGTIIFADAPEFERALEAYAYALKEADHLNRRIVS